jgi:hypothetical protein
MSSPGIDLKKEVPDYVLEIEDQKKMINVFNVGANQICEDVELIGIAHDFDRAEDKFLDLMLLEVAWTVDVKWSENQKRIIIKWNQKFFDEAGTNPGVQFAIQKIFGIDCVVTNATGAGSGQFIIAESLIGDGDTLGDDSKNYEFVVEIPTVSAQTEADIRKVVDFLRWGASQYTVSQSLP